MKAFLPDREIIAIIPGRDGSFEYSVVVFEDDEIKIGHRVSYVFQRVLKNMATSLPLLHQERAGTRGQVLKISDTLAFLPLRILPGLHGFGYFNCGHISGIIRKNSVWHVCMDNGLHIPVQWKLRTLIQKIDSAAVSLNQPRKTFNEALSIFFHDRYNARLEEGIRLANRLKAEHQNN
jgi:hypothetical protein